MAKRKRVQVQRMVESARCRVFATFPMICPLCLTEVKAKTLHQCERAGGETTVENTPIEGGTCGHSNR